MSSHDRATTYYGLEQKSNPSENNPVDFGVVFVQIHKRYLRQDLPELAKSYLFTIKITFDNILPDKAEEFNELANNLSARCRKVKFLKENTSDVFTIVEISFDEFEDYLVTTCIKNEYDYRPLFIEHEARVQR